MGEKNEEGKKGERGMKNNKQGKKKEINKGLKLEAWKKYFMKVMGEVEERVRMGEENRRLEKKMGGRVRFGGKQ